MRQLRLPLLTVLLLATMASAFPLPVRILATGDMHGWLQPVQVDGRWLGGAAEMLGYWHQVEQYTPASFLTISCGDIATGPAISTIFQGDSVVQAMNIDLEAQEKHLPHAA